MRVVQGEALVGDRQFWVTRPYEWKQLLAAKMLFALVCVNLPLLLLDIFLLAKAGFTPSHYVLGLLWVQFLIVLVVILPVMVLATITSSIWQVGLALLVIALYLVAMGVLSDQIPSSNFSSPIAESLVTVLLVGTCIGIVLLQYSRRKTARSRWLLASFAALPLLVLVATPYQSVIAHQYPHLETGQQPPVHLTVLPASKIDAADGENAEKEVEIQIPLGVSGIAGDSIVVISGLMAAIEASDGEQWSSGWQSPGTSLFPEQNRTEITFQVKRSFFEGVKSSPVKIRISLAFTVYRDGNRRRFLTPEGEFPMPDVGLCLAQAGYARSIHCRAPLRTPSSFLITSDLSETTCPVLEGESRAKPGTTTRHWDHHSDSGPAEIGISPLKEVDFYLGISNYSSTRITSGICPGTPLVLSSPTEVQRVRTELEANELRLPDYRLSDSRFGFVSFAIH